MVHETDYLHLLLFKRYRVQLNFFKYSLFFTAPTRIIEEANTNPTTTNWVPLPRTVRVIPRLVLQQ
jgi:hypothetical protein